LEGKGKEDKRWQGRKLGTQFHLGLFLFPPLLENKIRWEALHCSMTVMDDPLYS
jgi:hypothetical protein